MTSSFCKCEGDKATGLREEKQSIQTNYISLHRGDRPKTFEVNMSKETSQSTTPEYQLKLLNSKHPYEVVLSRRQAKL